MICAHVMCCQIWCTKLNKKRVSRRDSTESSYFGGIVLVAIDSYRTFPATFFITSIAKLQVQTQETPSQYTMLCQYTFPLKAKNFAFSHWQKVCNVVHSPGCHSPARGDLLAHRTRARHQNASPPLSVGSDYAMGFTST